jgi:hypothetical protein
MMKRKKEPCLLFASLSLFLPTKGNATGIDFHDWS